ncbi:MAG: hypothetical protein JWO11_4124, partial [Nocardioides sp.]|nr:hypothetical protein [Nocardioides sp.]
MIPVEDMRPCPWEGRWMPVNHPCVGDNENAPGPMTRAEGGNPHIKEI